MSKKQIQETTLANGLKLIGEVSPDSKSCALGFFVNTGARDEVEGESGVSHFLEHMMFKGTQLRNALDITYELGNIGAQANAYTSEEATVYYGGIIPEYFSKFQELLSDMLRPALDEDEFGTEKKVILEEIALYQDRPQFYLFEHALADYYGDHTAGKSVLGTVESISELTAAGMRAYFKRRYRPSNITLVAAGQFCWERFVDDAQSQCGGWEDAATDRVVEPYPTQELTRVYEKSDLNLGHVLLLSEGASSESDDRIAIGLLAHLIGDSRGSRIYWELVDKGLVDSAGADNDEKNGTGLFYAYASVRHEMMDEVIERLRGILSTPLDFTEEDLARAKTKLATRIVLGGELPMGRLMSLGSEWLARARTITLEDQIGAIRAVSAADIRAAVDRYDFDSWSVFRLIDTGE